MEGAGTCQVGSVDGTSENVKGRSEKTRKPTNVLCCSQDSPLRYELGPSKAGSGWTDQKEVSVHGAGRTDVFMWRIAGELVRAPARRRCLTNGSKPKWNVTGTP